MSGGVKAGLLFGLIALIAVPVISWVPYVGALLCGPVVAIGLGTGAGYLGLRWSDRSAGIGTGVLAGGIVGMGALAGSVIFFLVVVNLMMSMPEMQDVFADAIRNQQPNTQLTEEQLQGLVPLGGLIAGLCIGIFQLLFALGGGAVGGWLFTRNRAPLEPVSAAASLPSYTMLTPPLSNPTPGSTGQPSATKSEPPPPLAPLD
ncbi:MAG TPA: hypothetical protein VFS21_04055 [Roseiflexaceae bacterium]|nr:hypothetical protein [Roseiflexaceae bacterium]